MANDNQNEHKPLGMQQSNDPAVNQVMLNADEQQQQQQQQPQRTTPAAPLAGANMSATAALPRQQPQVKMPSQTLRQFYESIMPDDMKPKTEQELAEERKKNRRRQIINSLGEGLSALSNLFFTTQYAPNMYTGKGNSVEREKRRYDDMLRENRENALRYLSLMGGAEEKDRQQANADRAWQRQLERDAVADQQWQTNFTVAQQQADAKREREDEDRQYRRERDQIEDEREERKLAQNERELGLRQQSINVRASGGSGGGKRWKGHFYGQDYDSEDDYKQDVARAIDGWNAAHPDDQISWIRTKKTNKKTTKLGAVNENRQEDISVDELRSIEELAAEYERKNGYTRRKKGKGKGGGSEDDWSSYEVD